MAEEQTESKARATEGKGAALKAALAVAAVLALEGGTIGVMMFFTGGPAASKANSIDKDDRNESGSPAELLVVDDKYPNLKTGRQYLYDTEIYITVKQTHKDKVKAKLKSMKAQVSMAMATIIRKAHPSHFKEATLATLRRQVRAKLDKMLGQPPGEEADSYINQVLITKMTPFRSNY